MDLISLLARNVNETHIAEIRSLSLVQQCEHLGVTLKTLHAFSVYPQQPVPEDLGKNTGVRIDDFALDYFIQQGWNGDSTEGQLFSCISYAVTVKSWEARYKLTNIYNAPPKKISSRLADFIDRCCDELTTEYMVDCSRDKGAYVRASSRPYMGPERMREALESISPDFLRRCIELCVVKGGITGSSDITLYRKGEVRLVEIKTENDKLTPHQIAFILISLTHLGASYEVFRIDRRDPDKIRRKRRVQGVRGVKLEQTT